MEKLSALRCLPRKSIICFSIICVMFFACAFYSFFADFDSHVTSYKFVDRGEFLTEKKSLEADQKLPNSIVVHKAASNPEPSENFHTQHTLPKLLNKSIRPNSYHSKPHQRFSKAVQAETKYIYLVNVSSTTSALITPSSTSPPSLDTCHITMEDSKLILLWTPFFEYWDYLPKSPFNRCKRCRNCKITRDKSKLLESDAVIFHCRDMSIVDMPPVRLPHQRWVFYCLESPPYSDFPGLHYTQNMFNWTMSYRTDSDIPSPYGTFKKIHPSRKLDLQSLEWAWSNKSKSIAWMSSHCPTQGGRDSYTKELQKYIDVDIYGTCGRSICPPGKTEHCYQEFARNYKFFLAFENTICKDYITEKFFRTFKYNIIPVVFGGADYDKFAPPGSYIDALSFKSPKHLAFFLTGVGKSFKLYSSFFKWRKDYTVMLENRKECQLCSMLHRKDIKPSSYNNLRVWWVQGSPCKIWEPK